MKRDVTLKDIAEKLQVSVTTISKAINNHPDISRGRRKQISELIEKMGYVPNTMARTLRSKKSKFVGLIISDNSNPYYARVVKGVEETLSLQGYHTIIFSNDEDPEKEIRFISELRSIKVAGIIITPALGNTETVDMLKKFNIPYVLAHRYLNKENDNYIIADDIQAGYIATKYLLSKRHDRVLFINGDPHISAARDRYEGFKLAIEESNIEFNEKLTYRSGIMQEDGYYTMKDIIKDFIPPYSVLCFSDYVATGAMKALSEYGISMPEKVAIMGIDDIEMFSYMHPGLTTVHIPKKELGIKSAELLIEIMKAKDNSYDNNEIIEEQHIILAPKLIIRESA